MTSQVFTFFSLKGGDGKTTSCANIGISLGIIKKNILLIDLDPIANLTGSFVQEPDIDADSSDLFKKDIDVNKIAIKKVANNVDLIPSNPYNLQYMFLEKIKAAVSPFKVKVMVTGGEKSVFLDKESDFIQKLLHVYRSITSDNTEPMDTKNQYQPE